MSTIHVSHRTPIRTHPAEDDTTVLDDYLTARSFPATRDELQAILVRRHAPTRLLWELNGLAPNRRYVDLPDVYAALGGPTASPTPREPC